MNPNGDEFPMEGFASPTRPCEVPSVEQLDAYLESERRRRLLGEITSEFELSIGEIDAFLEAQRHRGVCDERQSSAHSQSWDMRVSLNAFDALKEFVIRRRRSQHDEQPPQSPSTPKTPSPSTWKEDRFESAELFTVTHEGSYTKATPTSIQGRSSSGKAQMAYGEHYAGSLKNGKKHGRGIYMWPDGANYVGEFQNDVICGEGVYTLANGRRYIGQWREELRPVELLPIVDGPLPDLFAPFQPPEDVGAVSASSESSVHEETRPACSLGQSSLVASKEECDSAPVSVLLCAREGDAEAKQKVKTFLSVMGIDAGPSPAHPPPLDHLRVPPQKKKAPMKKKRASYSAASYSPTSPRHRPRSCPQRVTPMTLRTIEAGMDFQNPFAAPPMSRTEWETFFDDEGRISNPEALRDRIFHGGCHADIRAEVWTFLLHAFPFDSTYDERADIKKEINERYREVRGKWGLTDVLSESHPAFLIAKDVTRTDRDHPYFQGDELPHPHMDVLSTILITWAVANPKVGYAQGMSDLAAPLLALFDDEAMAYTCLEGWMQQINHNFDKQLSGLMHQLDSLAKILRALDPPLHDFFVESDCLDLPFCSQWVMLFFKRQFDWDTSMRLWESLWANPYSPFFHLYLCATILCELRQSILDHELGEISMLLKSVDDHLVLPNVLLKGEALFMEYSEYLSRVHETDDV